MTSSPPSTSRLLRSEVAPQEPVCAGTTVADRGGSDHTEAVKGVEGFKGFKGFKEFASMREQIL
jgi:hypothetical protein